MSQVSSRWWYGNAATVLLGGLALSFAVLNIIAGGNTLFAVVMVWSWIFAMGVGLLSFVPFVIDVRHVQAADIKWNPRLWLYTLGYILTSPFVTSIVYLHHRNHKVGLF